MATELSIPPNIKDGYIRESGGKGPAKFSFTSNPKFDSKIYPFTDNLKTFIEQDAGIQNVNLPFNYNNFLNSIPKIQIRAYTQATIASEVFSILGTIMEGISTGIDGDSIWQNIAKKLGMSVDTAKSIIEGLKSKQGFENFARTLLGGLSAPYGVSVPDHDMLVKDLVYNLYYNLLDTTTNYWCELPAQIPSGFFDSDGKFGWDNGSQGFNLGNTKYGVLNMITSSFGMNLSPFFKPGVATANEQFNVVIDLCNDTIEHAVANYQFIHTIVPFNRWIQYGLAQGPGSLYDINIPGAQRFFMCTGDFKISYKGILRKVEINKVKTQIPDAYSLNLTFSSLLPNNFNNYIMGISPGTQDMFESIGGDYNPTRTKHGAMDTIKNNTEKAIKELTNDGLYYLKSNDTAYSSYEKDVADLGGSQDAKDITLAAHTEYISTKMEDLKNSEEYNAATPEKREQMEKDVLNDTSDAAIQEQDNIMAKHINAADSKTVSDLTTAYNEGQSLLTKDETDKQARDAAYQSGALNPKNFNQYHQYYPNETD